jgi:subfamily B ATP-binding cassette protein MsbA
MFPRGDRLPKAEDLLDRPGSPASLSPSAWRELRALMRRHRGHVAIGIILTLVSRAAGLVLPASSKYFIDDVLVDRRVDLLLPLRSGDQVFGRVRSKSGTNRLLPHQQL